MTRAARQAHQHLLTLADAKAAASTRRFFKPVHIQEDVFIGIPMPVLRKEVRLWRDLRLEDVVSLLHCREHEVRLFALLLMVARFDAGSPRERGAVYRAYRDHSPRINNWDFVDCSAPYILGAHLDQRSRRPLYRLAHSRDL